MKKTSTASAAAILALAVAVPAFAGGDHCGSKASATTADAQYSCSSKNTTAAWAGAWIQRSPSGKLMVAEVAKGSPAAKSGLKAGDILLAVNGYDLSDSEDRAMCASKASCNIGSAVTYTVQRNGATKSVKFKLEKMPSNATERFGRLSTFDPTLAAVVVEPNVN
jgi:C-terminal processing protease CtpA/Prc